MTLSKQMLFKISSLELVVLMMKSMRKGNEVFSIKNSDVRK